MTLDFLSMGNICRFPHLRETKSFLLRFLVSLTRPHICTYVTTVMSFIIQGLPEGGIKVFASQLHTHQTGKRVFTKHYRNGVELPELNRDNHYSPHYQEIRKLHRQVHVLPVSI